MGLEVEEGFYTLYDVYNADEAFLTGTAAEVGPVVEVDRRNIGAGVPGPVTKDIIARFHEYASAARGDAGERRGCRSWRLRRPAASCSTTPPCATACSARA